MTNITDTADLVRAGRTMLGRALGIKLGLTDFGHIIGYDGKNVFQTIKRLEAGDRGLSGPAAVRLRDLVQAASYAAHPLLVIPEWSFVIPLDEDEDDGSTIMIERRWFPRSLIVATVQAESSLADLNFKYIGMVRSAATSIKEMSVWCLDLDLLPRPEWHAPFYERAIALLATEANRQYLDERGTT